MYFGYLSSIGTPLPDNFPCVNNAEYTNGQIKMPFKKAVYLQYARTEKSETKSPKQSICYR